MVTLLFDGLEIDIANNASEDDQNMKVPDSFIALKYLRCKWADQDSAYPYEKHVKLGSSEGSRNIPSKAFLWKEDLIKQ